MWIVTVSLLLIYTGLRQSWVGAAASIGIVLSGLLGTGVRSRSGAVSIPLDFSFACCNVCWKHDVIYFSLHICLVALPTVASSGSWICCLDPYKLPFPWSTNLTCFPEMKWLACKATHINLCPLLQGKLFLLQTANFTRIWAWTQKPT